MGKERTTQELRRKGPTITRARTNCPSLHLVPKKKNTPFPPVVRERSEGRGHRLLIACLSMGPQDLGTLEKNGIWLVGEHEWEEEVTQFSVSMSQNPGLELQPPGPG